MLSAILSHLGTDHLDWLKNWILVPVYVVATIGVVIGVHWENTKKFTPPKQERGRKLLLWSLIIEVFAGFLTLETDAIISASQQSEIIALEKQLRPRTLDDDAQSNIEKALKPYQGLPYDLTIPPVLNHEPIPQYLEAGSFLVNHLLATLANCGWRLENVDGSIPTTPLAPAYAQQVARIQSPSEPAPIFLIGQFSGISGVKIVFDANKHPEWFKPVYALAVSLNDAFIWADVVSAPIGIGMPADAFTADRIHIVIGNKQ